MAMDARPGPGFPATLHLERTACAPFHEERRMKLTEATMFHRKSGGGPAAKREPSPEGLGLNSEHDLSAVGAALNLGPLAPVSLGAADWAMARRRRRTLGKAQKSEHQESDRC